jgi:hypothetical protein
LFDWVAVRVSKYRFILLFITSKYSGIKNTQYQYGVHRKATGENTGEMINRFVARYSSGARGGTINIRRVNVVLTP